MKPLYLELAHFGPYRDVTRLNFEEELNDGFFVITGPTGAGKSTLFEAIYFALYGEASKKERGIKDYRSDFSKEESTPSYVKFRFQVRGEIFEVLRTPQQVLPKKKGEGFREQKHEVVFSQIGRENFAPLTRIDEVRAKVESLLGLNQEQFKKIIMLPQGAFQNFLLAETQEKKVILRTLFDTERYLSLQERMKEKTSDMKKTYESLMREIDWHFSSAFKEGTKDLREAYEEQTEEAKLEKILLEDLKKIEASISKETHFLEGVIQRAQEEVTYQETKALLATHLSKEEAELSFKAKLKKMDEMLLFLAKEKELSHLKEVITKAEVSKKNLESAFFSYEKDKEAWLLNEVSYKENSNELKALSENLLHLEKSIEEAKVYQDNQKAFEAKKSALDSLEKTKKDILEKVEKLENQLKSTKEVLEKLSTLKLESSQLLNQIDEAKAREERMSAYLLKAKEINNLEEQRGLQLSLKASKEKAFEAAKKAYLALKDKVFELYRSELASLLTEGEPCPVCGSTIHSMPYHKASKVSLSDYEKVENNLKQAESDLNEIKQVISQLDYEIAHLKKDMALIEEALSLYGDEIGLAYQVQRVDLDRLVKEKASIEKMLTEEEALREKEEALQEEAKKLLEKAQEIETSYQLEKEVYIALLTRVEDYQGEPLEKLLEKKAHDEAKKARYESALSEYEALGKALTLRETRLATEKESLLKHLGENQEAYSALKASFEKEVKLAFDDFDYYESVKKELPRKEKISEGITRWEREKARLEGQLLDLEKRIATLPVGDEAKLSENLAELKARYNELSHKLGGLSESIKRKRDALKILEEKQRHLEQVTKDYGIYHNLVKLANGDNKWRMDFETFALIYYYDKVLYFANRRLQKMSEGRYYFIRQIETSDKRKQSGLGLDIMDEYTGRKRQVATLSGGESFKAALALALGLSDVVREESGGIELDTIFIDEGFGTLDEDALDSTLDTLMELEEGGRLVGIISHVAELKERIGTHLVVKSTKKGSVAYFEASQ